MLISVFQEKIALRDKRAQEKRLADADFPVVKKIGNFDFKFQRSITQKQVNRLLEIDWIDRMYNLIFLGPPGVGKSHLALALGYKVVDEGYKVSFVSMDRLMHTLKTAEISRSSKAKMNFIICFIECYILL